MSYGSITEYSSRPSASLWGLVLSRRGSMNTLLSDNGGFVLTAEDYPDSTDSQRKPH